MSIFYERLLIAISVLVISSSLVVASQDAGAARTRLKKIIGHMQPSSVALSDESEVQARRRMGRIAKQIAPEGTAATADFVKVPKHSSAIKRGWKRYLIEFGDTIIKQMLENEERYKEDFYVFYHAQSSENRIIPEFLRNVYEFRNKQQLRSDFEYLRFWRAGSNFADANSWVDSFDKVLGIPSDNSREGKVLVSTNPVLFGNLANRAECSFDYFVGNYNVSNPLSWLLKSLFDFYGFDVTQDYGVDIARNYDDLIKRNYGFDITAIDLLEHVARQFKTRTGDIVQIFIPKKVVDECAYLSGAWGNPIREYIVNEKDVALAPHDYDPVRKRYVKCSGILDIMQNNIGDIENSQAIQVRLFFSKSGPLLNPGLGAKMFRFTTLTADQLQEYKQQVHDISQKIFSTCKRNYKQRPDHAPLFTSEKVQEEKKINSAAGE